MFNELVVMCDLCLVISVPPSIAHEGPLDKRVIAGEEVILPCEATGFPKPRITWQKGTKVLSNNAGRSFFAFKMS